jgi:signal transduction histidine kinase
VVHDYGDVCQSITEIAMASNAPISSDEFHTLNRCLDDAIAGAVTAYGAHNDACALVEGDAGETARIGFFVHELRNLLQTATIAFEVLERGNVGLAGSTAAVLRRSLASLHSLVEKSIADIRVTSGIQRPEIFVVSRFIEELGSSARLQAVGRQVTIKVSAEDDAEILGDKQNLAAAINNLLQNAIKFTRPGSTVTLRASRSVERILIEVQDECGGLPAEQGAELFHPFEQRGSDRSGLGLGLAYSQWAVVANGGRIYVRNRPGLGCVFIADLPRHVRQPALTTTARASSLREATRPDKLALTSVPQRPPRPKSGARTSR